LLHHDLSESKGSSETKIPHEQPKMASQTENIYTQGGLAGLSGGLAGVSSGFAGLTGQYANGQCYLANTVADGTQRVMSAVTENGRHNATEHMALANNVCDGTSRAVSATVDGTMRNIDAIYQAGRDSASDHAQISRDVADQTGQCVNAVSDASSQNSAEHCAITAAIRDAECQSAKEACSIKSKLARTGKEIVLNDVRAAGEIAQLIDRNGFAGRAAVEREGSRIYDSLQRNFCDLSKQSGEQHMRDTLFHKETQLELLRAKCDLDRNIDRTREKLKYQAERNKCELKFQAEQNVCKLEKQADQNSCKAERQLADCCCELKEVIKSSAGSTNELVRNQELARIQDELAQTRQSLLQLQIYCGVTPGGISARSN
jgi:hypothetical protein